MSVKYYLSVIWSRRWILIGIFIFAVILGIAVSIFIHKPLYRANSTVVVDAENPSVIETQRKIIKSRRSAYYVFKRLGLDRIERFRNLKDPLDELLRRIRVDIVGNTRILRITAFDTNPKLASYIANEFAITYVGPGIRRLQVNNAWVQDIAEIPKVPVMPIKRLSIVLSIIAGLIGVFGITFFQKKKAKSVKDISGLSPSFDTPILGTVPEIRIDGRKIKKEMDMYRVIDVDSHSLTYESYRAIRNNLLFSLNDVGSPAKSIVVTGPESGRGKTLTAVNLAVMIARSGERILLVDANLKRPKLHTIFDKDNGFGFLDFFSQDSDFENIVKGSGIDNLYIVSSGKVTNRTIKSFSSPKLILFLEKAMPRFSKVIFDSSSLTLNKGIVGLLSSFCTGVVLVVEREMTPRRFLDDSRRMLQDEGAKVAGVIINK